MGLWMGDGRATVEGVSRFDFVVPELSLCRTFEVHVSCLWGSINTPKNTQKEIVFHIKGMYDWMQACKCRGWLTTQNHGGVWYRQYAKLQYTLITVPVRSSCVSPSLSLSPSLAMSLLPTSRYHSLACLQTHMRIQTNSDWGGFTNCWHRKWVLWSGSVLAQSCKTPRERFKINHS